MGIPACIHFSHICRILFIWKLDVFLQAAPWRRDVFTVYVLYSATGIIFIFIW